MCEGKFWLPDWNSKDVVTAELLLRHYLDSRHWGCPYEEVMLSEIQQAYL